MAQLGSYYGLCPLIDSKSLLGISEDLEKGVVIVTLGKNIACRYKLSDQKQTCSWRTKEKFSSPVIYDRKYSSYLAVFNQSHIKLWNAEEENLDKLKKYKFSKPIHSLIANKENTFVLFQNGYICTVEDALEMRKNLNIDPVILESEHIVNILYKKLKDNLYIGLIATSASELNLYWTKCGDVKCTFSKIRLQREDFDLKGCIFHVEGTTVAFLTLWSDGRIFSYHLEEADELIMPGELFATIEYVSTKYNVSMLSLDENYVAMYGANSNEEGAMLMIYNTQFKVTQSKQPFKLFTSDAKLWCIENNLLLPVGQNLAVIPFRLETEQLAALVGSHTIAQSVKDPDIAVIQEFEIAYWNDKHTLKDRQLPKMLICKIDELLKQGLAESVIIGELLPDIFKDHDVSSLSLYINYFSDIPEKYLAKILKYLITLDSRFFSDKKQHLSKLFPQDLQPAARTELIDRILCKSFNDILLLPHLRTELVLNDVLLLINYICFLWSEDGHMLPSLNVTKTEERLVNWSYALIDSNYQKLLVSKDESIKEMLIQFRKLINENLNCFEDLKVVSTFLSYYKDKKYFNNVTNVSSKYSVEQITLY